MTPHLFINAGIHGFSVIYFGVQSRPTHNARNGIGHLENPSVERSFLNSHKVGHFQRQRRSHATAQPNRAGLSRLKCIRPERQSFQSLLSASSADGFEFSQLSSEHLLESIALQMAIFFQQRQRRSVRVFFAKSPEPRAR